jgi:hypothetical protein
MIDMPTFRISWRLRVELWAHYHPLHVAAFYYFGLMTVWWS